MADYMDETKGVGSTQPRTSSGYNLNQIFHLGGEEGKEPTDHSRRIVTACIGLMTVVWTAMCILTVYGEDKLAAGEWWV